MSDSFRVDYANARRPIPQPDPGEPADLVSANFDYLAAGPSATITIGDYVLVLDGLLFVAWIGESLPLAERVAASAPDEWPALYRDDLPDLPPEATVHPWIAAGMQENAPVLVFVVDAPSNRVLIFTRSSADVGGPRLVRLERDREEPYVVARDDVVSAITGCLTQYLDDLVAAFPGLAEDESYRSYRQRLQVIGKPCR